VLVLLIISFCILKGSETNEASLSNINIGIQTFAYALYAASNLTAFIINAATDFYIAKAFDFISLLVLTITLLKIVGLQL
jgi:hypothetical protein